MDGKAAGKMVTSAVVHKSDADEDDDSVKQLQQCSSLYLLLQECVVNNNRDWKACQKEVKDLKLCNERRQNANKKNTNGGNQ